MADFVTLTMNAALDVSTATPRVVDTHKLRCTAAQFHPGGGGINVARVLHRLGADCLAVCPLGGPTGQRLRQLVDAEGVRSHCLPIRGETRESFSVHEAATGRDYRFVLPGPELAAGEWQACLDWVAATDPAPAWLVASGSLPPGVPTDFYGILARLARARGSRCAVDASGPALAAALAAGVHLAKPSLRELRELTGQALPAPADWLQAARGLVADGRAQMLALSLGAEGAVLVTAQGSWRATSAAVTVASTIGAGDSFAAGLLWALGRGDDPAQALRHASAAGAAALLAPGTALCQPADIERLLAQVQVARL